MGSNLTQHIRIDTTEVEAFLGNTGMWPLAQVLGVRDFGSSQSLDMYRELEALN
jgi:hypothetical protein